MASRNVDLLIRARDNASRAFKSVSDALGELGAVQEGVAADAGKLDAALGKSGTSAKAVASAIGGNVAKGLDQAEKIFSRIERTVSEATSQFERQKAELSENKAAFAALGKQAESAARAIKNAESRIGPQTEEQSARIDAMRRAYRDLTREIDKTGPKLEKQENQFDQNARELIGITSAARAATAALREVSQANEAAQGVNTRQARVQSANDAARKGIAGLANAERAVQIEVKARQDAAEAAALAQARDNAELENSVYDVVKAEERLSAIQNRRAAAEKARAANSNARSGLAGITAGLMAKARAEEAAEKAAAANRRATDALAASYAKQRAAARVSANDQRKLAGAFRQAYVAAREVRGPLRGVYAELVGLGPASASAANGVRRLAGQMTNGRQVFRAFYGDSRRALSLMQRVRGEVLSLTASFVGFYGVFNVGRGVLEAFQRLEAAQNRLGAAFDQDYDKVNAELAGLNAEASRLGISFDVLSDNYSKFLISGQQAGLEVDQLRTIFRQVSEAGRVLKLSNDQIAGTFNALIQIAGKGTLQMEELRQQLGDRLPGAVGLLAQALGYGEGQLAQFYKDVENGAVGAEEALVALGQGLENQYGGQLEDALDSVTAKIGSLQNLLFQRQLTAANSGFIAGLENALEALNAWLDSPEGIDFFEGLGAAFGRLFEVLPVVLENMGTLLNLFKAFVAVKVGQVVSGLASGFAKLTAVTVKNMRVQVALTRAVAAYSPAAAAALRSTTALGVGLRSLRAAASGLLVTFRAVFASIGGFVGIAAAALSFFAFDALASVDDSMSSLTATMEDADETIGQVAQAFREAGGDAERFRAKLDEISQLDLELDLKGLRAGLDQQFNGNRDAVTGIGKEVRNLEKAINDSVSNPRARAYFLRLTYLFDTGKISAGEFREQLGKLSRQFAEVGDVAGLDGFVDWLDALADAENKVETLEAELAVIQGTATDAQKELLGLATSTEEAAQKARAAQDRMSAFETAMRTLGENIPGVNAQLKKFDAIREIEADFQAALKAADAFSDAAKRASAIGAAVDLRNQAFDSLYQGQVSGYSGTDGARVAAQFLRDREDFRSLAYNDPRTDRNGNQIGPNIYRAGFGSDTITLDDGTVKKITQGMVVSVADANRDLFRRINTEFAPIAARAAGQDRFNSFNAQQQAALISIAYNYGEIPDRIAAAVRSGTSEEIAEAIKGLAGDNGGINRERRRLEAALFTSDAGVENQIAQSDREEENRRREAENLAERRASFRDGLQDEIEKTQLLNSLEGKRLIDAEVTKALREAENEARKLGIELTEQERAQIEQVTRAKFATRQAEEDRNTQLEKARALEEQANLLQERRRFLIEQITQLDGNGDLVGAAKLTEELEGVEAQLQEALDAALAFWEALGGEGSERAILALKQTQAEVNQVKSNAVTTGKQVNDLFADRLTSAFDNFAQRVANGENALDAFFTAFQQAAAEILIELGRMIIRQAIFNALAGAFGGGAGGGGGGVGGLIASGVNGLFHDGGLVHGNAVRSSRAVNPAIFANAIRYHSGGIAGLAPDEMPAILKKNEEVLTESDPRHRFNGGGAPGEDAGITLINTIDPQEAMERALSQPGGRRVLLNAIRSERTEIKAALG